MSSGIRHLNRSLMVVLVCFALTACGVPLSEAQPVPGYSAPGTPPPSSSPSTPATARTAQVWYVSGNALEPTMTTAPADGIAGLLGLLAKAPEGSTSIRTLVADPTGGPPLAALVGDPGAVEAVTPEDAVVVELTPTFAQLAAADQTLLIGQVVLTLTEARGAAIVFVDEAGAVLSVPLPDGRLKTGAVSRADYVGLADTAR